MFNRGSKPNMYGDRVEELKGNRDDTIDGGTHFLGDKDIASYEFALEGVKVDVDKAREVLGNFENVTVVDDMSKNEYPMPLTATDTDETYVGRIRKDIYADNILHLWGVADQVRVGAATNAVRIAQKWIKLEENA